MAVQKAALTWRGEQVKATVRDAVVRGLRQAGEHILTESRRVAPLDKGRPGTVVVRGIDGDMVATIAYDAPNAVRQHEDLTDRHAPGRQAKYLEGPLNAESRAALAIVAAAIRRATR